MCILQTSKVKFNFLSSFFRGQVLLRAKFCKYALTCLCGNASFLNLVYLNVLMKSFSNLYARFWTWICFSRPAHIIGMKVYLTHFNGIGLVKECCIRVKNRSPQITPVEYEGCDL
jgi:hypothetical protein